MGPSNYAIFPSSYAENDFSDRQIYTKTHDIIRWKSDELVDPRLLSVLEPFGEVYMDRPEFFKKIFHGNYGELFKKTSDALKKRKLIKKAGSMTRSISLRAMGQRGTEDDEIDALRLERFKVKTPNVIVATTQGSHEIQSEST